MVNQVETHVFNQQAASRKYMDEFDCRIMSWGPLAEGRNGFFTNPVLAEIGREHGKSAAQIALRFLLQDGVIVIPKSTHAERMRENLDILDFSLTDSQMDRIRALDTETTLFLDHHDGEVVKKFMSWRNPV